MQIGTIAIIAIVIGAITIISVFARRKRMGGGGVVNHHSGGVGGFGMSQQDIMRGQQQLNNWRGMIGATFEMFEVENPSRVETFRLDRVELFNLNNCVYLQCTSMHTGQFNYFSYDETDPTHQITSTNGSFNHPCNGRLLTSYNIMAQFDPSSANHIRGMFGQF